MGALPTIRKILADGGSVDAILDLRHDDPAVARMRVREFLEACPGIGPVRAGRMLAEFQIAESRRLRGLGEHQVRDLARRMGAPARG